MASYVTPKRGVAFKMFIGLFDQSNTKLLKANPTLAAGDFKVSIDGGALNNLTTLPSASPASSRNIMIDLSASEMTGDNITVIGVDAAGSEWCDVLINIQTSARQIDDLAYPATSGRSMVVDASGLVDANMVKAGPTGSGTAQTARDIGGAVPAAAAGASGGLLISGSNSGTTTLGALTVTGALTVSGGVTITNSTLNGHGIISTGNGTGSGLRVIGGGTGSGLAALNGGGSAAAATFFNQGTGPGLLLTGASSGAAFKLTPGSTGNGLEIAGGATSGDGINVTHTGASNYDINGSIHGTIDTATAVTTVNGLAANVITASSIATDAITAGKIAADAIGASELAADAVTEIQSGLATAAALTSAASDVTAIKAKTDSLTFTVAGQVDANIQYVNDVQVNGVGTAGNPWGP